MAASGLWPQHTVAATAYCGSLWPLATVYAITKIIQYSLFLYRFVYFLIYIDIFAVILATAAVSPAADDDDHDSAAAATAAASAATVAVASSAAAAATEINLPSFTSTAA